jgi:hypothetical protein
LFVAYVWNAGGLQTSLDDLFGGWNHSLRGQDALVAKWYLTALPILATTLVVALLYFLLSSAVGKAHKAVKRKQKRSETPMVAAADANVVPQAKPGMSGPEFVRPVRLVGARDESVLVKTLR